MNSNQLESRARRISLALLATIIALLLAGCKTQARVVTEYRDRVVHDTVQLVDSVFSDRLHIEYMKSDTLVLRDSVFLYKYKYIDRDREVYIHDSIPYTVEVEKKVRARNGYDRFTSWGFWILALLLLIRVAWWVFKTFYLRKS